MSEQDESNNFIQGFNLIGKGYGYDQNPFSQDFFLVFKMPLTFLKNC